MAENKKKVFSMDRFKFLIAAAITLSISACAKPAAMTDAKEAVRKYEEDYRAAVDLYRQLIREGNNSDAMRFELGKLYFGRAEYLSAIEEFKRSAHPQAGKMAAISYYNIGDYVEALDIFEKSGAEDDQALYYHGLTCEKLNLFDKAISLYRKIKSGEFAAKAASRLDIIEKQSGAVKVQDQDPQISKVISEAPPVRNYPQAGAQILLVDEKITVTPDNKEISSLHYLVKIINERGKEEFSETRIDYDSTYEKIELLSARTIKPDGTIVEVGSRHIRDVSKYMNFPLYSNARVFIISFPEIAEGSCVEYRVRIIRNQLVNKKDFVLDYPVQSSEPIIRADFVLEIPGNRKLFLKTINDKYNSFGADLNPRIEEQTDKKIYRWSFRDIPQIVPESSMPPAVEINPTIIASTFESWKEIYDWWWSLARDKISADSAIKAKVKELTSPAKDEEEKLRAIYNFCAKDIRYVAVEYGQAGYEPHQAADIFKNKYGDCKDQAILLVTMLTEAGFSASPVLISTRDAYNLDDNFPSMLFNHAIAAVNFSGKIFFLDATAETCSFGDLPPGDQQRKVFVCGRDGYRIEATPLFPAEHNNVRQEVDIRVAGDESVNVDKSVVSSGVYDQSQRYWLLYTMPEVVQEQIAAKAQEVSVGARLQGYKVKNLDDLNRAVELSYRFTGKEYLVAAGVLRIMPQAGALDASLVAKERRRYPIDFEFLDTKELELKLALPQGFVIKYIPEEISKDSPWMKFEAEYKQEKNTLVFRQRLEMKKNRVTESEYPQFKSFFEELAKSLKQRAVLERRK